MKAIFVLCAAITAVALLLAPSWACYAVLGLTVGWLTRLVFRRFLALRHRWLTIAGCCGGAFLLLLAISISIPSLMESRFAGGISSHCARYSADVQFEPEKSAWCIRDQITVRLNPSEFDRGLRRIYEQVGAGELDAEAIDAYLRQTEDGAWLDGALAPFGWTRIAETDSLPTFERERRIDAPSVWYAVRSENQIPVLSAARELPERFAVNPFGELRFHGPRDLIGTTQPAASQRELDAVDGPETIVVPFQFPQLPEHQAVPYVQVELLHPACRIPLIAGFRRLTSISAINWFLVAVFGVFQDRIRTRIGSPVVNWLGRRLGIRWLDGTPATETRPDGGQVIPRRRGSVSVRKAERPPGLLAALSDESDATRKRSA